MDRDNFDAIIRRYIEKFEETNDAHNAEYFKWKAAACFRKHWDLDAENLLEMFTNSIREFSVLLDSGKSAPVNGIKELLKHPAETETVRSAFQQLFAEDNGDLLLRQARAEAFVETINHRVDHYWPGAFLYRQTLRAAICYLAMGKPSENYVLFWSRANNWANCVEFGEDIGSGGDFSLPVFYRMCDELVAEIQKDPKLQELAVARASSAGVDLDDGYHLMAYDIIYCASAYNLYIDIPHYPKSTPKRVQRAAEREALIKLRLAWLEAKETYEQEVREHPPTLDFTGHAVRHKKFGTGTILKESSAFVWVSFDCGEKKLTAKDVYSKFLKFVQPEDQEALENALLHSGSLEALSSALKDKRTAYERAKADFDKKWKKTAQAEQDEEYEGNSSK